MLVYQRVEGQKEIENSKEKAIAVLLLQKLSFSQQKRKFEPTNVEISMNKTGSWNLPKITMVEQLAMG